MLFDTRKPIRLCAVIFISALLLAAFFIAPASADAENAQTFNGGTFSTAQALATTMGESLVSINGNTLTLKQDVNVTGQITLKLTEDIELIGNGHTIWRGGEGFFIFDVTSTSGSHTFTLGDGKTALTIDGQKAKFSSSANTKGLIAVNGTGTILVMNDKVTLTNSDVSKVPDNNDNGKPADADKRGIGVGSAVQVLHGAEFQMKGGDIIKNEQYKLGAVFVRYGEATFILSGGTISQNTAIDACGGVFIGETNDVFQMKGGEISLNTAKEGAGVWNQGKMTITAGEIHDNTALDGDGGGIYNIEGILTIDGGEIYKNKATANGGGIYTLGTVIINGGKIYQNEAEGEGSRGYGGGGIYNSAFDSEDGTVTINGGEISGNRALQGGGIYNFGVLNLKGGVITDNTATGPSGNGGGIAVGNSGELYVEGTPFVVGNFGNGIENNIKIYESQQIGIPNPLKNGAFLGISLTVNQGNNAFTDVYDTDYSMYFFADQGNTNKIIYEDKKLKITTGKTPDRIVTWKNDTTILKEQTYPFGTTPLTYGGATPTKAADDTYVYTFAGWAPDSGASVGKRVADLPPAYVNITYYTVFEKVPNSFTVTIQPSQNGEVTASPMTAKYQQEIILTAEPANGYMLKSYIIKTASGEAVDVVNGKFTMPAENVAVSAVFEKMPDNEPNTEPETDSSSKPQGQSIWLTETPTPTPAETLTPTETKPTPAQNETSVDDDEEEGGFPLVAIIGGLAVVLVILLIAVFVIRRRK